MNIIGIGNTAEVYDWADGKIIKLFYSGYPKGAVDKEFHNATSINSMNFAKPRAYELISHEERWGILYDKVEGDTLTDWLMKTGDIHKGAKFMADLHKEIHQNTINNVPYYKEFLISHLPKDLSKVRRDTILNNINHMPDGTTLCHGDFHPGNILIVGGKAYTIDFMNVCAGHYLYDVARTVFLVEYTPVPKGIPDRESMINFKKALANLYLAQMAVTRGMITEYIEVIKEVRKGECPDETASE